MTKKLFDNGYWWSTPSDDYIINQNALYFVITNVPLYCNEHNLPYPNNFYPEWRYEICWNGIDTWGIINKKLSFYELYNEDYMKTYNKYKNFNIEPDIISKL